MLINRQKARAEANFRLARAAVDDMYTQVAEKWLAQEPQMEPLQREFLLKALRFYERFARPDGLLGRGAPGGGQGRAAGRRDPAEAGRERGRRCRPSAARSGSSKGCPATPWPCQELAVTENRRGWFLWITGRSARRRLPAGPGPRHGS